MANAFTTGRMGCATLRVYCTWRHQWRVDLLERGRKAYQEKNFENVLLLSDSVYKEDMICHHQSWKWYTVEVESSSRVARTAGCGFWNMNFNIPKALLTKGSTNC
jgi:hypothetical protein